MATDRITLKSWFVRDLKPLGTQFAAWIDSFWHKDDELPITSIQNLQATLNAKADMDSVNSAIADAIAELELNIEVQDASLTQKGIVMLSDTLAADSTKAATPNLVAVINAALTGSIGSLAGNVYTKTEVEALIANLVSGLDWKDGVPTYADIPTTYPTPEIGWLVPCAADGIIYRWDGSNWVNSYLGILSAGLMKFEQNESLEPTFDGNRLALLSEIPAAVPDASTTTKGIVLLATDVVDELDTKVATQGAVHRAIDAVNGGISDLQGQINNIELLPGEAAPHVIIQYSADGTNWHSDYTVGDIYFHTSTDGGTTYGNAVLFKGQSGNSAFEDWLNIPGNESKTIDDFWAYLQGGTFLVSLDFEELTTFTYICPGAMKIDSVETNVAATVSIKKDGVSYVMGASLAKFDEITITPSTLCFVNLSCTTL